MWLDDEVKAGEPSEPFLIDIAGDGVWRRHTVVDAPPGPPTVHDFPEGFGAYWVRVTADHPGKATAWFRYGP